jgi:hypothetical protein
MYDSRIFTCGPQTQKPRLCDRNKQLSCAHDGGLRAPPTFFISHMQQTLLTRVQYATPNGWPAPLDATWHPGQHASLF